MGFWSSLVDVIAAPFTLPFGTTAGGVVDMFDPGHDAPQVGLPGEDQKTTYLKALQKRTADKYEQDLGRTIDEGKGLIQAKGRAALDDADRMTDQGMNSRGLLYSGKRQAEKEENAADIGSQVGAQAGEFEQGTRDRLRDLRADTIDSDINSAWNESAMAGLTRDQYAGKLSDTLRKRMQTQAAAGTFAKAGGKVAGTVLGGGA